MVFELATLKEVDRIALAKPEYPGASPYRLQRATIRTMLPGMVTSVFTSVDPIVHKETLGLAKINLNTREVDYQPIGPAFPMVGFTLDAGSQDGLLADDQPHRRQPRVGMVGVGSSRRQKVIKKVPVPARISFRFGMSSDGKKLYLYGAGSTIEFFDAARLCNRQKLLYLNKDTTTNLIVMAGSSFGMESTGAIAEWNGYRRLWAILRPYSRRLVLVLVISLAGTALSLVQPFISKLLIDSALLKNDMRALVWIAVLLFVATVARIRAQYPFQLPLRHCLGLDVIRHAACAIPASAGAFAALLRAIPAGRPDVPAQQRYGGSAARLRRHIAVFLSNVVFLMGSVALMLVLNWRLFLLSVVLVPACIYTFFRFQRKLTILTKQSARKQRRPG